jgi:hypothetical protein
MYSHLTAVPSHHRPIRMRGIYARFRLAARLFVCACRLLLAASPVPRNGATSITPQDPHAGQGSTNARALWLFNTFLKGDQNQKLVVKLDLLGFNTDGEFDAIFKQIWLLSKASLSSPTAINSWMEQRRLDQGLRTILLNQNSEVVRAVVTDLARTAGVSTTAETIVQWMRGQLTPNVSVVPATSNVTPIFRRKLPKEDALSGPRYWLVPCGPAHDGAKPIEQLHRWLSRGFWGVYRSTLCRLRLRAGDYICFYANRVGVAATARITGPADTAVSPAKWPEPYSQTKEVVKVPLRDIAWLDQPTPLTNALRGQLDAFKGRDL